MGCLYIPRKQTNFSTRNGKLEEYIVPGVNEETFIERLRQVLSDVNIIQTSTTPPIAEVSTRDPTAILSPPPEMAAPPAPSSYHSSVTHSDATSSFDISASDRPVTATPYRHGQVSESAKPESKHRMTDNPKKNWQAVQAQRKKKERDERERILAQIRSDQEDRRRIQTLRRDIYRSQKYDPSEQKSENRSATINSRYQIQVRLFDGSAIRSSFDPQDTINKNVRSWIDQNRSDGNRPYTLKHILTPFPNKTLSVTEEEQPLQELDLGSTASLVMIPITSYTEAYLSPPSITSLPARGISAGYNMVSGAINYTAHALGTVLGIGQNPYPNHAPVSGTDTLNSHSQSNAAGETVAASTQFRNQRNFGGNIRTIHDADTTGNAQFYNGNTVC